MNSNKIIGYILLVIGLLIIVWTLYQSYNIFTAKASAPLIFKTQILQQTSERQKTQDLQQQLQQQMEETIKKQISGLIPPDILPKILNLISWSILVGILIFGGGQISNIGIKLIVKS
jgi:L-cystine uptake protein TcyP (sodium:dicarboxylate symporter family)